MWPCSFHRIIHNIIKRAIFLGLPHSGRRRRLTFKLGSGIIQILEMLNTELDAGQIGDITFSLARLIQVAQRLLNHNQTRVVDRLVIYDSVRRSDPCEHRRTGCQCRNGNGGTAFPAVSQPRFD